MNKATVHVSLNDWIALCKLNISLPVALSTFTGFLLYAGSVSPSVIYVCFGVLLLACAASALNHILERKTDALMPRTLMRPIPSGRISVQAAGIFVAVAAATGALLLSFNGLIPLILGLFNLIWYSLVYTKLKRITAFAVVPGSLVGAIPPIIGWTAAGGQAWDLHIILVAFFFFVGQIPHFWLIIMRYGKDYEAAGLPSLTGLFSISQLAKLTLIWVAATAMTAVMLVFFGVFNTLFFSLAIFLLVIILLLSFRSWLGINKLPNPKNAFLAINIFYLGIMLALIGDSLLR
jgi:heme o synthase